MLKQSPLHQSLLLNHHDTMIQLVEGELSSCQLEVDWLTQLVCADVLVVSIQVDPLELLTHEALVNHSAKE